MRTLNMLAAIAIGTFAVSSVAQSNPPAGSQWLSIPQVVDKLDAAGYRNIEKVERERGSYEVKATDRNGQRVKLYLHPQTGEIMDRQGRDARRDRYGRNDAPNDPRNAPDCNERRCRDDLPVAIPSTGK
jgi:hypothetical protein